MSEINQFVSTGSDTLSHRGVEISKEKIADFCRRWKIAELALFGSILRDDFRPDSDIDVLVTFEPGARRTVHNLMDMKDELESMLGRPVDFVERRLVEKSGNYIRRKHILERARTIYVA